ncbi:MAG: TfoX/Sxy family protein [Anaerolineae bacterium]|nr:TfoX/Sxy family protein [Anaerolineae bacterium]
MPTDTPIHELRTLGRASAVLLATINIHTETDLRAVGPLAAYRRAQAVFGKHVSLHLLWAMQGALIDNPRRQLNL